MKARKMIGVSLASMTLLFVSACGGNTSGGNGTSNQASGTGAKDAENMVTSHMNVPVFKEPGGPIDAKAIAKGKKIFSMPFSTDIPYNVAMESAIKAAVEDAGGTYITWPNTGQQDQWVQGINQAISEKADAIILSSGFDVRTIQPQLALARKAGIKVEASTFGGETQGCPTFVDACVPMKYETAAEIMANYAIWKTAGKTDALVVTAKDVYSGSSMIPAIKKAFNKNCSACKTKFVDVVVENWSSQIQTEVQSALVADPSINYVVCLYDSMTTYVVPALLSASKVGQVGLTGFNGTPGPMKLVQDGQASLDVGQDIQWAGYASVDLAFRLLSGTAPNSGLVNENIPLRAFDKSNLSEAGNPPRITAGYGTAAVDGYRKMWGLK